MIIDRDDEETQYAIVHVEDIEDNIQKAPNNQCGKKIPNVI